METSQPGSAGAAFPDGAVPFAEGVIGNACLADRRAAASRARCGCVQAAADMTLTQSQQQRGTGYFSDPARLQETRQSDARGNERFWDAWTRFSETAQTLCVRA